MSDRQIIRLETAADLARIVAQAETENWTTLALLGEDFAWMKGDISASLPQGAPIYLAHLFAADSLAGIGRLASLHTLCISGLKFAPGVTASIASLTGLQNLALVYADLDAADAAHIAKLQALTNLNLGDNSIGDNGAAHIAKLQALTNLDLGDNSIGDNGAAHIAKLQALTNLDLWDNSIGENGAAHIAKLQALTNLNLGNNSIGESGAAHIAKLQALTNLDLRRNNIGENGARRLLDALSDRPNQIDELQISANPGFTAILPPEALDTHDAQAILSAYRAFKAAEAAATLRPLNEAKLLVVGNEAIGKTSLIRFLLHGQPRNPDEAKTPGIAQHERIETQDWAPDGCDARLNVWDFGGQEIMHGTHRYFLTERSLYLLVLSDRREDDDTVEPWLETIANRSGGSPIVIVINKSDDGKADRRLDEAKLKHDYPAIRAILRASCNDDAYSRDRIKDLRAAVAALLNDDDAMRHVRTPIPASWLKVKAAVTARAEATRYLRADDYRQICQDRGLLGDDIITDADAQRALLRLLHELGAIVAHGLDRDAPQALQQVTLLDPNWLTDAVYTVLLKTKLADTAATFRRADLRNWLDPAVYPVEQHEFILSMMMNPDIALCFRLPGAGAETYLAPEALTKNSPDFSGWTEGALQFRYRYKFLPPGLIPRFIVEANRNITEQPHRWYSGVQLQARGCPVLVLGDRHERRVDIFVTGPAGMRRSALNIVLDHLEYVHGLNPGIEPEAFAPLPDAPDLEEKYDHLLRLEERYGGDHVFLPRDAEREYTVAELLDGVRRDRTRLNDRWSDDPGGRQPRSAAPAPLPQPVATAPAPTPPSNRWTWVAATAAGAVMFGVAVLFLLPPEWRPIFGGILSVGFTVFLIVLRADPANWYRRCFVTWSIIGFVRMGLGGLSLETGAMPLIDKLAWNGEPSDTQFIIWASIAALLLFADVFSRHNNQG